MWNYIIQTIIGLTESLLFYYIVSNCLKRRFDGFKNCLCVLINGVFLTLIYLFSDSSALLVLLTFAEEAALLFVFTKSSTPNRLFWACICAILPVVAEEACTLLFVTPPGKAIAAACGGWMLTGLVRAAFYLLFEALLYAAAARLKNHAVRLLVPFLLTFLLLAFIVIFTTESFGGMLRSLYASDPALAERLLPSLCLTQASFLLIFLFFFVLIAFIDRSNQKLLRLQQTTEQQKSEQNQYELLASSNRRLREWKHDSQNHLQAVLQMMKAGRYEESERYIGQFLETLSTAGGDVCSGNYAVDAILSVKKRAALEAHIPFSYELLLPDGALLPLSDVEITSLFGNLMNNAIEACASVSEPFIQLSVKPSQSSLMIEITNSADGQYRYDEKGAFKSTKGGAHRGIGLTRVKDIVDKAGGFCYTQPEADAFIFTAVLPLSS